MENQTLLFWNPGPAVKLTSPEIARELLWGEEVDGLVDLPIRQLLDGLKAEFSDHRETAGQLDARAGGGTFAATWTWQFLRLDCHDLPVGERERLIETVESFGCQAYENRDSQP